MGKDKDKDKDKDLEEKDLKYLLEYLELLNRIVLLLSPIVLLFGFSGFSIYSIFIAKDPSFIVNFSYSFEIFLFYYAALTLFLIIFIVFLLASPLLFQVIEDALPQILKNILSTILFLILYIILIILYIKQGGFFILPIIGHNMPTLSYYIINIIIFIPIFILIFILLLLIIMSTRVILIITMIMRVISKVEGKNKIIDRIIKAILKNKIIRIIKAILLLFMRVILTAEGKDRIKAILFLFIIIAVTYTKFLIITPLKLSKLGYFQAILTLEKEYINQPGFQDCLKMCQTEEEREEEQQNTSTYNSNQPQDIQNNNYQKLFFVFLRTSSEYIVGCSKHSNVRIYIPSDKVIAIKYVENQKTRGQKIQPNNNKK